jgi:hypothetical protein
MLGSGNRRLEISTERLTGKVFPPVGVDGHCIRGASSVPGLESNSNKNSGEVKADGASVEP